MHVIQELWKIDAGEARQMVEHAADLVPGVGLTGNPMPPRLPATARAACAGLLGDAQIRIVRATMRRIASIEGMDVETETLAETLLAGLGG